MSLDTLPPIAARDVPVATAAQMAEADRIASQDLGIPLEVLMENAGRQVAAATRLVLGETREELIAAVVGTGNNGGDALVALRHLHGWGAAVDAYVAGPAERLRPLARRQLEALRDLDVDLYDTTAIADRALIHRLKGRRVVIDGLLGYSTTAAPHGEIARLIEVVAEAAGAGQVVAVDLPSGLHPDTGENLSRRAGGVVPAAVTVTLALPKPGLVRDGARPWVGELLLGDIGIPPAVYETMGIDARSVFVAGDLLRIIR